MTLAHVSPRHGHHQRASFSHSLSAVSASAHGCTRRHVFGIPEWLCQHKRQARASVTTWDAKVVGNSFVYTHTSNEVMTDRWLKQERRHRTARLVYFWSSKNDFLKGQNVSWNHQKGREKGGGGMLKFLQLDQKQQPIRVLPPSVFCQGLWIM